jgi:hypothetical protein
MHGIFSTSCLIGEDVREASIMGFRERIKDFLGINTSIISMLIMVIDQDRLSRGGTADSESIKETLVNSKTYPLLLLSPGLDESK